MLEHGVGDGVEERLLGMARRVLAPPDRGKHRDREGACLPEFHGPGVADDLPDAFAAMLAMDEEAFPARGQHPDAETPELAVADVVGGLAGPERPNAGVGEYQTYACLFSPLRLQPGNRQLQKPFPGNQMREKKRLFIR